MGTYHHADEGIIWIQTGGPGSKMRPLVCYDTDGPEETYGESATRMHKGMDRRYTADLKRQGLPSDSTITLEADTPKVRDWLMRQARARCPVNIYIQQSACGRLDNVLEYETGMRLTNGMINSRGNSAMARGREDAGGGPPDVTGHSFEVTGDPEVIDYRPLLTTPRSSIAEVPGRAIHWLPIDSCGDECGAAVSPCTYGIITCDNDGAATADVLFTTDGGVTWAAIASAPFAVSLAITGVTSFWLNATTVRVLVARGTTSVAAAASVAYNDLTVATEAWSGWTSVDLPTANGDFVPWGGGLFSRDGRHIWACTNDGLVVFSNDYGITWEDQAAPLPVGGAEPLYKIAFVDSNYGVCVGGTGGASSVFLSTSDGGVHWALGTGPAAELLTGAAMLSATMVWVCTYDGELYRSDNGGLTWTEYTLPVTPASLSDLAFQGAFDGVVGGYKTVVADDYPVVFRTYNGGADWEVYALDTAFDGAVAEGGVNAVAICDANTMWAVGEQIGTFALILDLADQDETV